MADLALPIALAALAAAFAAGAAAGACLTPRLRRRGASAPAGGSAAAAATRAEPERPGNAAPEAAGAGGPRCDSARLDRRLAEVGRMTGGLAHEIKNPLSTIGLNVQLLREDVAQVGGLLASGGGVAGGDEALAGLQRIQRRLDGVHRETARLRDILDDFLRFAGRIRLDLNATDPDRVVGELVDFFHPEAEARGVRLRTDPGNRGRPLRADGALLKQALLNLLMNAVQAMAPGGGRGAEGPAAARELLVRTGDDPADARSVLLEVIDNGPGIAADALERIFEPYHSGRRGGTGLGLPTSRRIVELHGGTLTVDSEPGRGTSFQIRLPREGPPAAAPDAG
ncbi:sensor histidine kinase [Phycisphaera mikurensis]|uniref:histidine kinase n=1 Tax=Phycisphaera mikurensis (strain NBRC 102666 / KCTC 22515 / FYK2301M01) TaxID=1142394 RepID=I0IBQ2_PHYMF|nr:HAMP domain-containing sensor histidine kinase [Phycisphaera mikurensis]MBB6443386.1 signal transduction histidine kinase [Phycisphaera mikurensis]BAM02690.1 putative two-component system sensor histidine kinase [Phycisphaera mikurensis NBRC 102666]